METNSSTPMIVFTSFWDANYLLKQESIGDFPLQYGGSPETNNHSVFSIALSQPKINLPILHERFGHVLPRLNFLCPTFEILKEYKETKAWEPYVKEYRRLIVERKEEIIKWVDGLKPNHIYMLCCWEKTSPTVHCHRQLLYQALIDSNKMKNKAVYIYRNG